METLISKSGSFWCMSEEAVEIAHMVSNLEGAYELDHESEVLLLFGDYLSGRKDCDEVNKILFEEWPEAFPGLRNNA